MQIGTFMTDIADEFKIVVVEAIRSLCLKFPQKYRALMNFLSSVLREDGGFEYKKAIVDSILILIREIPDAKESGLAHLCEFCLHWLHLCAAASIHLTRWQLNACPVLRPVFAYVCWLSLLLKCCLVN